MESARQAGASRVARPSREGLRVFGRGSHRNRRSPATGNSRPQFSAKNRDGASTSLLQSEGRVSITRRSTRFVLAEPSSEGGTLSTCMKRGSSLESEPSCDDPIAVNSPAFHAGKRSSILRRRAKIGLVAKLDKAPDYESGDCRGSNPREVANPSACRKAWKST